MFVSFASGRKGQGAGGRCGGRGGERQTERETERKRKNEKAGWQITLEAINWNLYFKRQVLEYHLKS